MWVNILTKEQTKKYMILTDEDLGCGETYILDKLEDDGWERFCDVYHTFEKAGWFMHEFYPEYAPLRYLPVPISFSEACTFIKQIHRHHPPPQGCKFCLAVSDGERVVGVAIAGRPVSRYRDDGKTLEVTRLCVKDGYKNACSLLYGMVCRIAKVMGYQTVITYTLEAEKGASLLAAGFQNTGFTKGGSWDCKSRPRINKHPLESKNLWEHNIN